MEEKMEKQNELNFAELDSDEFLNEEETTPTESAEEEITPESFAQYTYLKNPEVGESIELEIAKIIKKPGRTLKNSNTGKEFQTGLEDKNGKRTETIIETMNGERFTINSWGLFFSLFGKNADFQKIAQQKKSYQGIKIRITHLYNGKDATTSSSDLMKLRGFATIEEATKHKQVVETAMKEGKIYKVEIL